MAATRAQLNKAVRQQALREQLQAQGHVQHVVELMGEVRNLPDTDSEDGQFRLSCYKVVMDNHWKAINKYLPDLRAIEHSGMVADNYDEWLKTQNGAQETTDAE